MKATHAIIFSLLAASCAQAATEPIYFYWTATGASQYDAYFEYSGGTVANGIFTPTGLISYSIGTPFGVYTPSQHDPFFGFFTDTPFGPSFNLQGTIEPVLFANNGIDPGYQVFSGNDFGLNFQDDTEQVIAFENGAPSGFTLTGTWTEVVPDVVNTGLLLAAALGALGFFRFTSRRGVTNGP
jgi:hypothetical protein